MNSLVSKSFVGSASEVITCVFPSEAEEHMVGECGGRRSMIMAWVEVLGWESRIKLEI